MDYDGDAFISYAHLDNVALAEGHKGWVANLQRAPLRALTRPVVRGAAAVIANSRWLAGRLEAGIELGRQAASAKEAELRAEYLAQRGGDDGAVR